MGSCLELKRGFLRSISLSSLKDVQERFHYTPPMAVTAPPEREPIKVEAKQDKSRQADEGPPSWVAALPVSALLVRILVVGTIIMTGVLLAIVRSRY
jgi:hypothetical protein